LIIQAMHEDLAEMIPIIEQLDRPTPQILIEAHIVESDRQALRELGVQWGGLYNNAYDNGNYWIVPDAGDAGGLIPGAGNTVANAASSGFMVNFPWSTRNVAVPGSGLSLGFIAESIGGNILQAQLQALEQEQKVDILSSPSITTQDNQTASIELGSEIPYQTLSDQGVNVEYRKAVLSLEVTPHVIEGDTLKLKIITTKDQPSISQFVGDQPYIDTQRATTTVTLFDGQTTVIAGFSEESDGERESGVPGVKDTPLLGWLFKGRGTVKEKRELLIFITPYILSEQPSE
jgi:type IV pilus assembly protein PilQ